MASFNNNTTRHLEVQKGELDQGQVLWSYKGTGILNIKVKCISWTCLTDWSCTNPEVINAFPNQFEVFMENYMDVFSIFQWTSSILHTKKLLNLLDDFYISSHLIKQH